MITITCPQCGLTLLLPDHLQGRTVTCSGCKRGIDASAAEPVPETPLPTGPPPPRRPAPEREPRRSLDRDDDRSAPRARDRDRDRDRDREDETASDPDTGVARGFMLLAGILGFLIGVAVLILNVVEMQYIPSGMNADQVFLFGMLIGTVIVLVSFIVPAAFQFVGAQVLGRFRGWGLLVTAAVLSLVFGLVQSFCCGGGVLVIITGIPASERDAMFPLRVIASCAQLGLGILNLVVGVVILSALNSVAVIHAYRRHNPQYRKYLEEDDHRPLRRWGD